MRILIGGFVAECNAYVDKPMMLEDFSITRGDAVADILYVREPAAECGVELVPSLMAYGGGGGRVDGAAFEYILTQFKNAVKEHLHDIDGMFFFFHGASSVIDLEGDSGDHALVREIRKITGPYMPLAMVMDPHGNLSQEQADNCNIIRTFRHSPHTDRKDAHQVVFPRAGGPAEGPPRDPPHLQKGADPAGRRALCPPRTSRLVSINKLLKRDRGRPPHPDLLLPYRLPAPRQRKVRRCRYGHAEPPRG